MAFTSTRTRDDAIGGKRMNFGTFANDGASTGGDINTGLTRCEAMFLTALASAVGNAPVVYETLPCAGNAVTIVTDADESGVWMAIGR